MKSPRDGCWPIERVAEVRASPEDDARRRHAEACPRCWDQLHGLDDFVGASPVDVKEQSDLEWFRVNHPLPVTTRPTHTARSARSGPISQWFRAFWRPALALPLAAVLVVNALHFSKQAEQRRTRGDDPGVEAHVVAVRVDWTASGLAVSWNQVSSATRYEVVSFDSTLAEVERSAVPEGATTLVLPGSDDSARMIGTRLQVEAYRESALLAASEAVLIPKR